ncbi:MAG: hypothetical protein AAGG38_03125 [Planctomycetota bacterium]
MIEKPIVESMLENMTAAAGEGAQLVGVGVEDEPLAIVRAVNQYLEPVKKVGLRNGVGRPTLTTGPNVRCRSAACGVWRSGVVSIGNGCLW